MTPRFPSLLVNFLECAICFQKNRSREEASLLTGLKRFSWWNQGKEEGFLKKDSPTRLPHQAFDGPDYNSAGPECPRGYS